MASVNAQLCGTYTITKLSLQTRRLSDGHVDGVEAVSTQLQVEKLKFNTESARDVRVLVHAEDGRARRERQGLDVVHVTLVRVFRVRVDASVRAGRLERIVLLEDSRSIEALHDDVAGPYIYIVRDAAAIIYIRG